MSRKPVTDRRRNPVLTGESRLIAPIYASDPGDILTGEDTSLGLNPVLGVLRLSRSTGNLRARRNHRKITKSTIIRDRLVHNSRIQ